MIQKLSTKVDLIQLLQVAEDLALELGEHNRALLISLARHGFAFPLSIGQTVVRRGNRLHTSEPNGLADFVVSELRHRPADNAMIITLRLAE